MFYYRSHNLVQWVKTWVVAPGDRSRCLPLLIEVFVLQVKYLQHEKTNADRFLKNAVYFYDLFLTGETLSVVAKICNSSSKEMRPKFKLQQKIVYSCKKHTNPTFKTLCKMVGDTISPNSEQTVSCKIKIPGDIAPTLHNCDIISVEYYVKVWNNFIVISWYLSNETPSFVNDHG